MPSSEHAILVDLFRVRPSLVSVLLEKLDVAVPAGPAEVADSTFPVSVADRHADLVLLFQAPSGPQLALVVEVQLGVDPDKPRRWLPYHVGVEARHRCDVAVLVVAPDARVARWARAPSAVGPRGSFAPLVVGPEETARLTDVPVSDRTPEFAVLSALAHRGELDAIELRATAQVLAAAERERASLTFDLLQARFVDIVAYATAVLLALTDNAALAEPTVPLAVFEADIAALDAAHTRSRTRTRGLTAERDARLAIVLSDLERLRAYVHAVAARAPEGASALVTAAGMSLKRVGSHAKAPLVARPGSVSGSVRLVAKSAGDRASYEWQLRLDGESWSDLPPTRKAKTVVSGLPQARRVFFRCRALTKAGLGDFGQVVSLAVP